jgi:arylsulfatase A-like enzyme
MKGTHFEGGYRVPMIARWPGKIPAGQVSDTLAVMMDLFTTAQAATGAKMPDDRVLDGRDLLPVLTEKVPSHHEFVFGQKDSKLATIRDARWKLHVMTSGLMGMKPGPDGKWKDFRHPDGVTILAPFEQYNIDSHPGLTTGDGPRPMMLFDLKNDPGEQRDVSAQHPDEVKRLKAAYDRMNKSVPVVKEVKREPQKK